METLQAGSLEMSFKRTASKVWWGSESLEFREVSSSPGSQDSGFSDTETSPHHLGKNRNKNNKQEPPNPIIPEENNNEHTPKIMSKGQLAKNIFKRTQDTSPNNECSNYKEKCTPTKSIDQRLVKTDKRNSPLFLKKYTDGCTYSEPSRRPRYIKHSSPKLSRNLFKECDTNQYAKPITPTEEPAEEISCLSQGHDTSSVISGTKSLPLAATTPEVVPQLGQSAPSVLYEEYEGVTSFNSSSECESELEQIFDHLEHTSTPKRNDGMMQPRLRLQEQMRWRHEERVPPLHQPVKMWMEEARLCIEQECTTTLQFKSIAGELNQKVNHLATCATTILRGLLSHARNIEMDFNSITVQSGYDQLQNVAKNIMDFLKTHTSHVSPRCLKLHDHILVTSENALKALEELYREWQAMQRQILVSEVQKLVGKLEDPTSEMDLRVTLTGITSVALRNGDLIEHFIKAEIIPILLILCEKCEGSSIRTLILRALSTMCTNSGAIRHFEKFSGVQIISDTLQEDVRPEPERSEAVALLAQVTAPWMEDNHSLKGLQEYSSTLVHSLTKFTSTTNCCQNLLLCAAALANLSSMDSSSIKTIVQAKTAAVLLQALNNRGPMASVYLLEQVATLLANMAAVDVARIQLTECNAPVALLHFLKTKCHNEDVERRLQQKSVIALSRLSGDFEAARQIVDNGGVRKLVKLCREKQERFNSDAVLVAALATLRKIADACGKGVIDVQDCQELVEPKLLDSFLAYSTQNESYV